MKLALLASLSLLTSIHAAAVLRVQDSLFESSSKKMKAGDYQGAETGFLVVLRSDPNNVSALGNLGVIYTHTQRYALAIKSYEKALRIRPNERGFLLNIGLIYLKEDDYERARPYFRKLHSMYPKDAQPTTLLATCMIYGGQPKAGIDLLRPLIENNPDNGALYLIAVAYSRIGMGEMSEKIFAQLFPDAMTNPKARFLL